VASTALHLGMSPRQGKLRGLVIEPDGLPGRLHMAAGTLAAQLSLVPVITKVALHAVDRRLGKLDTRSMAGPTRHTDMPALQRIVREVVIEVLPVEDNQNCGSPLVLGMAPAAGRRPDHRIQSVIPL